MPETGRKHLDFGIWGFAFGYFACYIPYSALTKATSKGLIPGMDGPVSGFFILPASAMTSLIGMLLFLTFMGWWRHAGRARILGRSIPAPSRYTFISGLCTAAIVATTTLAYTFEGVSIVFVMLLMRGGLLILAPVVDAVARRSVRWFSWAGLVLSILALLAAFSDRSGNHASGFGLPTLCAIDITIYLSSYFVRLRFMSRLAKSADGDANLRYFVEEQLIATPAVVLTLAMWGFLGTSEVAAQIHDGFTEVWTSNVLWQALLIGAFSQGTGIFGGLILLDKRENTYCVPVNRSSSILAGVLASFSLTLLLGQRPPSPFELTGASLIITAILFLTIPPMMERRMAAASQRRGAAL